MLDVAPEPPAQQPHDPEEPSAINFDIRPGSQWTHRNGNRYTVVATANEHSTDPERYPITVVYLGTNGRLWSRRADDWHRSMTPEPPAQPRRPYGTDTMSEYGVIPECDGSEPPAQQPMVDFDIAIAAGDGTLHGAIDHWQERALTAEAKLAAQQPMTEEEIETLMLTTPDNLFEWVRAVEMHHGIGKGESND